ncbi:hypothetical protein [Rufibacter roseus]|uniref:Uncharacterized protein n=1 Tax=Rufibacter roseus TaxID=1567108 RepID=A0ABW2DJM2_9BACT|nr:hypothetical protein [Rufibacter roseus]
MENRFTPGPWHVGYASPESKENCTLAVWQKEALDSGFGSVICKVSPELTANVTDEANARLIAAAPELLEALEELSGLMQGVIEGDYQPDSFTLQLAKQAYYKATGNSLEPRKVGE